MALPLIVIVVVPNLRIFSGFNLVGYENDKRGAQPCVIDQFNI